MSEAPLPTAPVRPHLVTETQEGLRDGVPVNVHPTGWVGGAGTVERGADPAVSRPWQGTGLPTPSLWARGLLLVQGLDLWPGGGQTLPGTRNSGVLSLRGAPRGSANHTHPSCPTSPGSDTPKVHLW